MRSKDIELKKQKDGSYSGIKKESKQNDSTIIKPRAHSRRCAHASDALAYALAGNNITKGEVVFQKTKNGRLLPGGEKIIVHRCRINFDQ